MSKKEVSGKKKVFVSYVDDDDQQIEGWFEDVSEAQSGSLIIHSGINKIRIPQGRWKKTKEER